MPAICWARSALGLSALGPALRWVCRVLGPQYSRSPELWFFNALEPSCSCGGRDAQPNILFSAFIDRLLNATNTEDK